MRQRIIHYDPRTKKKSNRLGCLADKKKIPTTKGVSRPARKRCARQVRTKKKSGRKGCLPPCKKKVCLTIQERKKRVPHRATTQKKKKKQTAKTVSHPLKRKKSQVKGCSSPIQEKKKSKWKRALPKKSNR